MNKEFIPYEEALALKELGFDEPCLATIDQTEYVHITGTKYPIRGAMCYNEISTPLYQQAFRWFREKYGLCNFINFSGDGFCSGWEDLGNNEHGFENFKTYEEAELACLRKLIEIVKTK